MTSNYTYDNLYQLTQVTQGASTTESYSYDAVGNRLSSLGVSPYAYNSSNELTSTPSASYAYDHNGNTTSKTDPSGTTTYNWDSDNQLTSVVLPASGGTVSFKYDPFGRRIQKSSTSGTVNYLYDGKGSGANVLEEVDNAGNVQTRVISGRGIDEILSAFSSAQSYFFGADGLGSITSLTTSSGTMANSYTYDSYGNLSASSGTAINPFQYTAREVDVETGLIYNRARYYEPKIGRFISEDPIQFKGGANFYEYVKNDPISHTDPLGLCGDCHVTCIRLGTVLPIYLCKDVGFELCNCPLGNGFFLIPDTRVCTNQPNCIICPLCMVSCGWFRRGEV